MLYWFSLPAGIAVLSWHIELEKKNDSQSTDNRYQIGYFRFHRLRLYSLGLGSMTDN
jgi:hypothetical protein